jgi:hypothetical protein
VTANAVTHTCQATDEQVSIVDLIAALHRCWQAIRTRHPDVPAAIIVVASGSPTRASQAMKWGHFATLRWQHGTTRLPEVLVSGEGLSRTPEQVLTTLLHEAAHSLADTRNIKDTSRQGRWHNQRFATHARELGLEPAKDDKLGWSPCTLPPATADTYRAELDQLTAALGTYRHADIAETATRTSSNNGVACECDCGRKIRVSRTVYETGPILCGTCDGRFLPDDDLGLDGGDPS